MFNEEKALENFLMVIKEVFEENVAAFIDKKEKAFIIIQHNKINYIFGKEEIEKKFAD